MRENRLNNDKFPNIVRNAYAMTHFDRTSHREREQT